MMLLRKLSLMVCNLDICRKIIDEEKECAVFDVSGCSNVLAFRGSYSVGSSLLPFEVQKVRNH